MKYLLVLAVILTAPPPVFAEKLECWDLNKKSDSVTALTSDILSNEHLAQISINEKFNKEGLKPDATGEILPARYHVYKGYRGFALASGVLLILPPDLSEDTLSHTTIPGGKNSDARQNAVLEVSAGRVSDDQSGQVFFRMHCRSRLSYSY